jgi:CRP-like cAMP-binding protein
MDQFITLLNSIIPLKYNINDELISVSKRIKLKARTVILNAGESQEFLYFLIDGVVRAYDIDEIGEYTSWFFSSGELAFSSDSYLTNRSSTENLETISDAVLVKINRHDVTDLAIRSPEFRHAIFTLLETHLSQRRQRDLAMSRYKGVDRYSWFLANFPKVNQAAQINQLATFLGMQPESLSRLRRTPIKKRY